ncbi:hypothetical protein Bca4012_042635 [Brassica carinata]
MATQVDPPNGVKNQGKHYFSMWQTLFEIDTEYVSITPIGRGASGGISFSRFYPNSHVLALICFRRCSFLTHPSKRISVTEALQHPYLAPLYDPSSNPPAEVPIDLDVDVDEDEDLGALL